MHAAVDAGFAVFHHHAQLFQAFCQQPRQFAGHIADVQIRAFVERIGEHAQLVAFKREIRIGATHRRRCQRRRPVAQRDDKFIVCQRPIQQALHLAAFGQLVKRAVPAGNQHRQIGRIGRGYRVQNVRQFGGFVQLGQIFGIDFSDGGIFVRHRPHFKFGMVARQGCHVNFKACFVDMQHRQQRFHGVVAR